MKRNFVQKPRSSEIVVKNKADILTLNVGIRSDLTKLKVNIYILFMQNQKKN